MRRARPANASSFGVTCPAWARSGDEVHLELTSGDRFMITVPPDIQPGDDFTVRLPASAGIDEEQPVKVLPRPTCVTCVTLDCPPGKGEGDVMCFHPHGNGEALWVTIPAGASPGAPFTVMVQDAGARDSCLVRAFLFCVPTCYVGVIWLVVALNYTMLVLLRQVTAGRGQP